MKLSLPRPLSQKSTHFVLCSLSLLALVAVPAHAQTYPNRAVRAIVPYAAGGGVDVVARIVAPKMSEGLGQQLVIDNRGGAAGNIGAEIAARSAPDGYTVLIAGSSLTINASLYSKLPFDAMKDFTPVTAIAVS